MEYYIRSAGTSPSQDYSWVKITPKGQQKESPPLDPDIYQLIESEKFSSVLWRNENQLLLLITGLQSSRADYQRRIIRNSVVWVGTYDDEQHLRAIAIFALSNKDELQSQIDNIIKASTTNEEGFILTFVDIEKASKKSNIIQSSLAPDQEKFIGHNSEKLLRDIVDTLKTKSLPKQLGGLVVVSELVPRQSLENAGVWRSLSTLVESVEWEKVKPKHTSFIENFLNYNWSTKIFIILPVIIIPIMLLLAIFNYDILKSNSNICKFIASKQSSIKDLHLKSIVPQNSSVKYGLFYPKDSLKYEIKKDFKISQQQSNFKDVKISNFDDCK